MSDELLARITSDPDIFDGKPIIRGQRIAVEHIWQMLCANDQPDEIVTAYGGLIEPDDIRAVELWREQQTGIEWQLRDLYEVYRYGATKHMWEDVTRPVKLKVLADAAERIEKLERGLAVMWRVSNGQWNDGGSPENIILQMKGLIIELLHGDDDGED
jgi:uncharacterized protein (DUF433 family)